MPAAYGGVEEEEMGVLPQKHHQFSETKAAAVAAEAKYYQMQAGYPGQQYHMNHPHPSSSAAAAAYFQQMQQHHHQQAMYSNGMNSMQKEADSHHHHQQQGAGAAATPSKMAASTHSPKDGSRSSEEVVKVEPKVSKNIVHSGQQEYLGQQQNGMVPGWIGGGGGGSGVSVQNGFSSPASVAAPSTSHPMPAHSKQHVTAATAAPNPYHPYAAAAWMNGQGYGGPTPSQFGYPVAGYTQANYGCPSTASYPIYPPPQVKEERDQIPTQGNTASSIRDMETERAGRRARRNRTCFTKQQMDRLEELLEENRYPDVYRREEIAKELDLKEEVIRVWFKNRRAKAKREQKDRRFMYQANVPNGNAWAGHMTSQYPSPSTGSNPSPESSTYNATTGEVIKSESPPVTPSDYYQAAFNHIAPTNSAEAAALMAQTNGSSGSSIIPPGIGDGMQYMVTPGGHSADYSREATASPSEDSQSFLSEEVSQEGCATFSEASHAFQSFAS